MSVRTYRRKNGDMHRAIVGQLLDYAAYAAVYWSIDSVKHCLQKQYGDPERAQDALDAFLESAGLEENDFWRRVEKNFEEHNIRIVFVADELPPQLRRVIEFLDGQMKDVEVLGTQLEFVQRGKTPGLRITPSKQDDPAAVALAMMDFIQATRVPIEKAILATR